MLCQWFRVTAECDVTRRPKTKIIEVGTKSNEHRKAERNWRTCYLYMPQWSARESATSHKLVLRRSEMPPVDIAAQSRHRSAVARSLAVGQITTHPPWPLRPAGLPAPRSTGTRRAHARAKHRRCCCPWRRAAWRPPVLPSSPEREEHARAVAVSPRTAADENAEQCGCLFWQQRLWR